MPQSGINHLDVAPMYGKGEAERVVGEALKGKGHSAINLTTKCSLGTVPDSEVYTRLNSSLCRSLETMGVEKVNLFLLHSQLIEDDYQLPVLNEHRATNATTLSCYYSAVIPAFEMLKKEGKIDHWGICTIKNCYIREFLAGFLLPSSNLRVILFGEQLL